MGYLEYKILGNILKEHKNATLDYNKFFLWHLCFVHSGFACTLAMLSGISDPINLIL